jgi:hypothetical protein
MTRTGVGLRVERSDAPYAMLELELQANASGPPLYELNALDESLAVEAGIPRSYANDRDEPARVLLVCTHASAGSASETSSETFHRALLVGAPLAA